MHRRGDPACHIIGRPAEEWNAEIRSQLPFKQALGFEALQAQAGGTLERRDDRRRIRKQKFPEVAQPLTDSAGLAVRAEAMRQVVELARRAAQVDSMVLITGESGVGKERIARVIHFESAQRGGPFIAVNCAAVTETLLESELFGHAKGAFTGALADRVGLFEAAGAGTLFLDKVGEIPLALQAKLLRVLQEARGSPVSARIMPVPSRPASWRQPIAIWRGGRSRPLPTRSLLSLESH